MAVNCKWSEGAQSPLVKIKPQEAYSLFEKIRRDSGGNLYPEDVVEASRPKDALLHNVFTWDNQLAAEKYRIEQARNAIRHLVVVYKTSKDQHPKQTRLYISVSQKEERKNRPYLPVHEIARDAETKEAVVRRAWMDLLAWKAKYSALTEFLDIHRAIEEVQKKMLKVA